MLTQEMMDLIATYTTGFVATVRADGSPAVSPKATFVVLDDRTIAFANIRSRGTVENLRCRPNVEVNFFDVFARKACRGRGFARYILRRDAEAGLQRRFEEGWPDLHHLMQGFILIDITAAEIILSPAYDIGANAGQLTEQWLRRYAFTLGFTLTKSEGRQRVRA